MDLKNNITSRLFGQTADGQDVTEYTLTNTTGASVSILNYGGIITKLLVPNTEGILTNVVLGYDSMKDYEGQSPYFGCITGRVAGRIGNATFTLNDQTYVLDKNDGNNSLHGGIKGFDKVIWSAATSVNAEKVTLSLNYLSPDGDQGFPGELDTIVLYHWDNDNTLTIVYEATTDKATILTLTNHTYFNLSGNPTDTILDHILKIEADKYIIVEPDTIPKELGDVTGTPFDFRVEKAIGQDIDSDFEQLQFAGGYDHAFELNKDAINPISLYCKKSGIHMAMTTNENCVVCYSGNYLTDALTVSGGHTLQKRSAVCLETQDYPNAINADFLPSDLILEPGKIYRKKTTFTFTTL